MERSEHCGVSRTPCIQRVPHAPQSADSGRRPPGKTFQQPASCSLRLPVLAIAHPALAPEAVPIGRHVPRRRLMEVVEVHRISSSQARRPRAGWHEADICDITMLVSDRLHRIANNHRERTVLRVWSVLLGVRRGGVQPAAPTCVTRTCCTRVSRRTLRRSEMHLYLSVRYLCTYSRGTFVSLSEVPV